MSVSSATHRAAPEVGTTHGATMEAAGTHATTMEAATASKSATSTTAGECIIGNQTCGDNNSSG